MTWKKPRPWDEVVPFSSLPVSVFTWPRLWMKKLNMDSWREMFYEKIEEVKPQDHWDLKMDQNLDYNDLGPGWKQSLQEHSFASFQCSRCQHFWSSVQVVILFHMYLDQHRRKGWVKMRVFRQECYECSEGKLEEPNFKEESVQRVLESLVISIREKCYGEYVAQLSEVTVIGRHYGPHRSDHCEACLLGIHQRPKHTMYYGRPKDTFQLVWFALTGELVLLILPECVDNC
uniref:3CxxC-type domain-containing protein n=1 Tax=Gopherus evgoodei TaxID=1825980 RepID=A0A8C4YDZ1_9SAUR